MTTAKPVQVVKDPLIAAYGFGYKHPFGPDRHDVFHAELARSGVADNVEFVQARRASRDELTTYHTDRYVDFVQTSCSDGTHFLDGGDTPAFDGLYEAATAVVGGTLNLVAAIMTGETPRAFIPSAACIMPTVIAQPDFAYLMIAELLPKFCDLSTGSVASRTWISTHITAMACSMHSKRIRYFLLQISMKMAAPCSRGLGTPMRPARVPQSARSSIFRCDHGQMMNALCKLGMK